jgi:imidazolonepropionase-like amidohydrolase
MQMRPSAPGAVGSLALIATAVYALCATAAQAAERLLLTGARIYISSDVAPIDNGVVLIEDRKIAAVSPQSATALPDDARRSECSGGVVLAGFQNSHVHFLGGEFAQAGTQPAESLARALVAMLTRYGYTTVVDTASDRSNTLALRTRIESGEVPGPHILTTGLPIFPARGLPAYINHLPREFLDLMPQPRTAAEAVRVIQENMQAGADGTKLFVATPQADYSVKRLPLEIARQAAEETHRYGKLVMAHPTDLEGVRTALAAKVDLLVHTTLGAREPWPDTVLRQVIDADLAVIPTFKLLAHELHKEGVPDEHAQQILARTLQNFTPFAAAGGRVIFGTDVGYMTDYDPTDEYTLMAQAGLTPMQILASLTSSPAALWRQERTRGRLAPGMDADIVVLDADPGEDPRNFAKIRCTIRQGRVIYPAR